jgi:hypothetical protein
MDHGQAQKKTERHGNMSALRPGIAARIFRVFPSFSVPVRDLRINNDHVVGSNYPPNSKNMLAKGLGKFGISAIQG